jgi:hypothetical protein
MQTSVGAIYRVPLGIYLNHLLEQGVLPSVVMAFGGWDDWETFRRHYLGEFSPEAIRRECAKIDFLGG